MKLRTLALACILGLAPFAAKAGSWGFSVASPVFTGSKTYTIPDADMVILFAYIQGTYQAPPCVPVAPATTCVTTPYTLAQSMQAWAAAIVAGTIANVQNFNTVPPVVPPPITAN